MASSSRSASGSVALPPPPPPPRKSEIVEKPQFSIISRPGNGTLGRPISLVTNHFTVSVKKEDAVFYQYTVMFMQDGKAVEGKDIGRRIMDKLFETYKTNLAGKKFAYDGENILYTVGPLPATKSQFTVVLEESFPNRERSSPDGRTGKRSKRSFQEKTFDVTIAYSTKIPLNSINRALSGKGDSNVQDALRVLDVILRQQAAKRKCLLVKQSFFNNDQRNVINVGGGVTGVRGFHSSFRTTQNGLTLNIDVSTTMTIKPGPVIDFLIESQNLRNPQDIDWRKAKRMLKSLKVRTMHTKMEFKVFGLSELPCNQQRFSLKVRDRDGRTTAAGETVEMTVYEYFTKQRGIELTFSQFLPCLDVGKPKRPNYLPVELCELSPLHRYTKALSPMQRASLVEKSRQKPHEKMKTVQGAMETYKFDNDLLLGECGISIDKKLIRVEGRVLETPKLKVGNSQDCIPNNGRWNFNNKTFVRPVQIENWIIVNFSARCDPSCISQDLINCARKKGVDIARPQAIIDEDSSARRCNPVVRVERMFQQMKAKISKCPGFILCLLPERKNSEVYGPWKKQCLTTDDGIVSQCISPMKINDQYLTNLLLKINTKLGGINSLLAIEYSSRIPMITETPTLILGMDVSHGSPGRSDVPSVAAVVGSVNWPLISRYRASVRTQSPKLEMIESLYKPMADGKDDGMIRELLMAFFNTSEGRKPKQIIVFRDGVSESQFNQVLNIEIEQIVKTYEHLGEPEPPKLTVIVAQKNHHTKLFQANGSQNVNVPPGTIVDTQIVHPQNYDFYMCAHAGMIGTSRPVHYHVLIDQIGFSPDALQNIIHSLSYAYQRSTTAPSVVAPIAYAHHAAAQMSQFIRYDDLAETSSAHNSITSDGPVHVPELPRLHVRVVDSMFFC